MRPPGDPGDGGGGGRPENGTAMRTRAGLGVPGTLLPFFPGGGGGGQMRARAGDADGGGGGGRPETGEAARRRSGPSVPDLPHYFAGGGTIHEVPGGDGDGVFGGRPATGTVASVPDAVPCTQFSSNIPVQFDTLDDEVWMGKSMLSMLIGTQESVNFANLVHSQVAVNMEDDQAQGEQFMEAGEWSNDESDSDVEDFIVHCEGDTDVEELFPIPTYEELAVEEAAKSKEELQKENRVIQAKLRAVRTKKVKKRAADYEAGIEDKGMTFSDQDSEDCRDLSDSSEDDGVVPKTSLSVTKRKSRAKKMHKRIYYDESRENAHDQLCLHMCFVDVHQCRRALVNHHIHSCRNFEFLENTPSRVVVCCKSDGTCAFTMTTSIIKGEKTHCIRQLVMPHTCGTTTSSSRINAEWISKTYEGNIKSEPDMKVKALIDMVKRDYGVEVSKHMAYRAKNKALENMEGQQKSQYLRIRDYLQTVIDCNPGSRCVVQTITNPDPQKNPMFHGLFFCLHAQVQGFLEGCRPFIGVDGCFLKLSNGAQVLAATARDGNNNLYPLAFGVVGKEETSTWCWFLMQLRYALGGGSGKYGPFTIMSDRQKGLLKAVSQIFPECEQRFCLRHILANFQLAGFRGGDLKKLVDAAAYAFTKNDHIAAMQKIREDSEDAWKWLSKIPTKHWARHAMDTTCKTDLIVNNISEVFNNYILEQRDKPIGTMAEQIRVKLMVRYKTNRNGAAKAQWEIAPHYLEKLEIEKRAARWFQSMPSTNVLWQVSRSGHETYVVDLEKQTCGCFKWQFTGMPCKHAISAIYARRHDHPEDYVSDFFKKPCYQKAYQETIFPVPGQHDWTKTDTPDIEPPIFTRQAGRKKKKRRIGPTETTHNGRGYVASITCSNCKLKGHRYTTCTMPLKSHLVVRKQQHKSNRQFPGPFVPPAASQGASAAPASSTTSQGASAAPDSSTTSQDARAAPASTTRTYATTGTSPTPHAPWIPPRQADPSHAPPHGQQRGGGYENSRLYSYFTPGLDAQNRQEEE